MMMAANLSAASASNLAAAVFGLDAVYVLTGLVLLVFAAMTFADRRHPHRWGSGSFWLILGVIFALGSVLPHAVIGLLVLAMVVLDGAGRVKPTNAPAGAVPAGATPVGTAPVVPADGSPRESGAVSPLGDRVFLPVLVIPMVTVAVAVAFRLLGLDVNRGALVGLGFGGVAAMGVALWLTGSTPRVLMGEGRRLNECMGAVTILPQLLASLGVVFAAAGVGQIVAGGITRVVPHDSLFLLVLANCLAMTLFTVVMGNSFAAFPVIAAGVLAPLLLVPFGVDPAMAGIITLTAGSSGTLMTPMAANFNIVPAALLEMRNPYGVLKFQLPYALVIWTAHVLLLWGLVRFMAA